MARGGRALGKLGNLTKKDRAGTYGFDELVTALRRMSDQARVEITQGAVDEMALEGHGIMSAYAPRHSGPPTRGAHAADNIINETVWSKRDSRRRFVGLGHGVSWWLMWEEIGSYNDSSGQQFIRPTRDDMKGRSKAILLKHWRRVTSKIVGPSKRPDQ